MNAVSLVTLSLLCGPHPALSASGPAEEVSKEITVAELRGHVYRLSGADYMGRRGPGAARASRHLADAFARLKLRPAFGVSYYQPIPWLLADEKDRENSFVGRNVGAMIPGTDPKLSDEWIVLCAHFDHLGVRDGVMYPGADDNASGVAMLLEVAEHLALRKEKPRRTIVFVAFDQEEAGLLGSTHFAAHAPFPFKKLKACLTCDMLGRSMAGVMDEYVFALGSESSPRLRKLVEDVPTPTGLKVGRVGADLIGSRSDYAPFRDRSIPFLFFSTGHHEDYHSPADLPEKLDYVKLQRICVWIGGILDRVANDDQAPEWQPISQPDLDEVRTVHTLLTRVLEKPGAFPLSEGQRGQVQVVVKSLEQIIAKGGLTATERTALIWTARLLMLSVFQ